MTSSLVSTTLLWLLFPALVLTSALVFSMHRKLASFERRHAEYKTILEKSGTDLIAVRDAVSALVADGRDTLFELDEKIRIAKEAIHTLDPPKYPLNS